MKKNFVILLAILGFYSSAFAQQFWEESNKKIEFNIHVGYNDAYVFPSYATTTSYVNAFNAGFSVEYLFSDKWGLKVKASYDQKGWSNGVFIDAMGTETDGVSYHLNYITIPIMANWHFGPNNNWYLNFGPYAGILMSVNASIPTPSLKSSFNSIDYGLSYGFGKKFPIGENLNLFTEFGGEGGFNQIFKHSDGWGYQNIKESFNIGINF